MTPAALSQAPRGPDATKPQTEDDMTLTNEFRREFAKQRAWQIKTYGPRLLGLPSGETMREFTGGGAAPGFHALAAFMAAKRRIYARRQAEKRLRGHA